MSNPFSQNTPPPPPQPDTGAGEAASDRLRKALAGRRGRQMNVLTRTRDQGTPGSRPRSTLLGGGPAA